MKALSALICVGTVLLVASSTMRIAHVEGMKPILDESLLDEKFQLAQDAKVARAKVKLRSGAQVTVKGHRGIQLFRLSEDGSQFLVGPTTNTIFYNRIEVELVTEVVLEHNKVQLVYYDDGEKTLDLLLNTDEEASKFAFDVADTVGIGLKQEL